MAQNLLPTARIHNDVRAFSAKGSKARGVCAGFPCQAGWLSLDLNFTLICDVFPFAVCSKFGLKNYFAQGTSGAGAQRGLQDDRSNLVCEVFKIYDSLDDPARRFLYVVCVIVMPLDVCYHITMCVNFVCWFVGLFVCLFVCLIVCLFVLFVRSFVRSFVLVWLGLVWICFVCLFVCFCLLGSY